MSLQNKHILLGITGGIAAYKTADLVQQLRARGAEVRVVMTEAAHRFIGASSLQALSGHAVVSDWLDDDGDGMEHIHLARWADVMVVAPLSANTLAKMAHGRADNVLTSLYLASPPRVAVAPAMNVAMWSHAATQENIACLRARGVSVWGPEEGRLACGEVGAGRMCEPAELVARLDALFAARANALRVMVTAGPTIEAIDPVRYISNHSSGKMGFALADAAAQRGAEVTLIAGPVSLATPQGVSRVDVVSARQMLDEVLRRVGEIDWFIACAAVADYRCAPPSERKIKKEGATMNLVLERTEDILATVAMRDARPFCVGFAAETEAVAANARAKMLAKKLDMVVANEVGEECEYGFGGDENRATAYWRDGEQDLGVMSKTEMARRLIELIEEQYESARRRAQAARSQSA